ncbi:Triacylglycerol lipase 2 [Cladobotryum mycophilum]|uniref:GPI inositol-deacylase n=1 Tax=Cladobotryum mycophilum TaxID=491253 RepID=A0ABR0S5I7_9HYPO
MNEIFVRCSALRRFDVLRRRVVRRLFTTGRVSRQGDDARMRDLGRRISDDFAALRDHYATPKHPIVLAHGLLGFSELSLLPFMRPIQYWHGIKEALSSNGSTVLTASVPPSSSIQDRAAKLASDIISGAHANKATTINTATTVNIIAHSMGGLDARYMISRLRPRGVEVASLVTVATPHRGSPLADYLIGGEGRGPVYLPRLYGAIERMGLGTQAFEQLTTRYMAEEFNPLVVDDASVRYFSYGAATNRPSLFDPFRLPYRIVEKADGMNDGLVSVESSRWGTYKGTLMDVSHLDLINWTNKIQWTVRGWMGIKRTFNAIAFYMGVADMLAKEGL